MATVPVLRSRSQLVDAARGFALALMTAYHLCFDVAFFGLTDWDFYHDPFWLHYRTLILSGFLLLVGISLVLAQRSGFRPRAFGRRLAQVLAGALLVSVATRWLFGAYWVTFGVLHFIALASVLALPLVARPWAALPLGAIALVVGNLISNPWFDAGPTRWWIGLMTHKPPTEDCVPVLPWIGVVLLGITLGQHLLARGWLLPSGADANGFIRALAWAGRHSLVIYLLHQPLLMGAIAAVAWLLGKP